MTFDLDIGCFFLTLSRSSSQINVISQRSKITRGKYCFSTKSENKRWETS